MSWFKEEKEIPRTTYWTVIQCDNCGQHGCVDIKLGVRIEAFIAKNKCKNCLCPLGKEVKK